MRIRAGVAADSTVTAWDATRVGANIAPDMVGAALPGLLPALPDRLVEAAVDVVDKAMRVAPGRGLGIAAHGSYESYVAQVAEVSVAGGAIRVHKVLCVIDCGLAVNPDVVRAQMEGSVVYGLSAALHGNLEVENGAIRESNFHDYPILRMHESPEVEVIIVDSDEPPTGAGEPGVPPVAPAVANAVFAAVGQRLTSLPLKLA